ncbi:transketolase-like protein 1 isoform X2 [Cynocephalus volans]|uniref:transketolase-like protein 1 isoform X2 n=1 Tax=Cynocephalus volans TaxID=110931 RepID=UPI002FC9AEF5
MSDSEATTSRVHEAIPDQNTVQVLRDMANRLRIQSIRAMCSSQSSTAEIMSVLLFHTMRYKQADPENPDNDRFILPKKLALSDAVIGWCGQGLGAACGMAYTGKYFDKASFRVYCLVSGDISEGSVWEAMAFASHHALDNLVVIFDTNCVIYGASSPPGHCTDVYQKRCEAFGCNTYVVDGRNVEALCQVFWQAAQVKNRPTAVIAKTFRGRGMPNIEDAENWYGKPMSKERADAIIELIESQIQTNRNLTPNLPIEDSPEISIGDVKMSTPPAYQMGSKLATQKACGLALAKLGHVNERLIMLDGDNKNTFSEVFKNEHPERFIECFIAEQNMVSVALGCASRGRTIAFASTFAALLIRAFDQIRAGAVAEMNINLIGSHCGVSVGEDGPLLMALEDLAMFRAIPNCTIFYPSDAVSTERAVYLAANNKGMCYIRTSQPETAIIYTPQETFQIGQAKVVRENVNDKVTVIGAGVTLHEALAAADNLSKEDIFIRVIDLFTIKPLDVATIITNAKATGGRIITVEDHYPEGGIGEAVCAAVSTEPGIVVHQLAVLEVPRSGKPQELLDKFGISAKQIAVTVKCIVMD